MSGRHDDAIREAATSRLFLFTGQDEIGFDP
jgi:hypothetical protein